MSIGSIAATTADHREITVARPDGRVLAASDHGPLEGPVVVFLHSAPGSRRFDPDPRATGAAGIRLITIDRAGYGDSSPIGDGVVPTVAGHAADTAAVLDHLGVTDASVVGWSAGGRVALALAAARPELVRSVGVVGTPAPDDVVPWVQPEHRELSAMLRDDPASAVATIVSVFSGGSDPTPAADEGDGAPSGAPAPAGPSLMVTNGGAADAALLEDPEVSGRVDAMIGFGFQRGPAGIATDIVADQVVPWGFDVSAVGAPVTLVYGDADAVVTPDHGRWYADQLANATLRVVGGAGHLVVVTEWAAILAAALAR